jgi:hypothetical protein
VLDVSRFSGFVARSCSVDGRSDLGGVARTSTSRRPPFALPEGAARDYVDGALSIPFLKRSRGKRMALDRPGPKRRAGRAGDVSSRSLGAMRFGSYEQLADQSGA